MSPIAQGCWWNANDLLYRDRVHANGAPCFYVEGWAIRHGEEGRLEAFEHGWVEVGGEERDDSPDHGCVERFAGLRFSDPAGFSANHPHHISIPFYRWLVPRTLEDGSENPDHDPEAAEQYLRARSGAEAYCAAINRGGESGEVT